MHTTCTCTDGVDDAIFESSVKGSKRHLRAGRPWRIGVRISPLNIRFFRVSLRALTVFSSATPHHGTLRGRQSLSGHGGTDSGDLAQDRPRHGQARWKEATSVSCRTFPSQHAIVF